MAATPKKLVHWDLGLSPEFGSSFEGDSTDSTTSASSLQYVNSQLLAHGFTHGSGLSLDGLGKDDTEKVVKCLLGMLSQRVDDMSRTEELTTKLRTLSYEHERLASMLKNANDRATNAEREMNMHKSRLASANQTLQTTESAHKRTTAELQRTRTALQSLRLAHQTEIKKIEKEKERVLERWSKVADNQLKLGSESSRIRFANSQVVEASDVQLRGKGQGLLEAALEQSEHSRNQLADEVRSLRGIVISTANELQRILQIARSISLSEVQDEPAQLTTTSLFPLTPANAASEKLTSLLGSTRELIERLAHSHATLAQSTPSHASSSKPKEQVQKQEVDKLGLVIDGLRKELEEAKKQSSAYAAEAQALQDQYARNPQLFHGAGDTADMSVDLMTEEKTQLTQQTQELEKDRRWYTQANTVLSNERAALEEERAQLLEEKRQWELDRMSVDVPPTLAAPSAASSSRANVHATTKPLSPRKIKVGVSKRARSSRRSSGIGLSPKRSKVIPAYETEVIPSSANAPHFSTSLVEASPAPPALSTTFTLPPPSPAATIRRSNPLELPPLPQLDFGTTSSSSSSSLPSYEADVDMHPPEPSIPSSNPVHSQTVPSSSSAPSTSAPQPQVPNTPGNRRPFPVAKPLATHMIHAYSPVKPSPLSRILLMANSPDSPENGGAPALQTLTEEDESMPDVSPTPTPIGLGPPPQKRKAPPMPSLAAELGLEDSDEDDNPLRDRPSERIGNSRSKQKVAPEQRRFTAREKGKARADPSAVTRTRSGAIEKRIRRNA
ncbi:hypothetical protein QCA50_011088 [Cerrena zonata]|uniref:Afadin and alpha-actinin-binding-domain-containing protein n=1 Tax=Cerrena zonata TaxID=2478898 RepID=A0AAW0G2L4_9APHY